MGRRTLDGAQAGSIMHTATITEQAYPRTKTNFELTSVQNSEVAWIMVHFESEEQDSAATLRDMANHRATYELPQRVRAQQDIIHLTNGAQRCYKNTYMLHD